MIFDLNLPPNEDSVIAGSKKAKRMKFQKKTKGKSILKFDLSDEDKSDGKFQDAECSFSSRINDSQSKGNSMLKKMTQGAADQQPRFKI